MVRSAVEADAISFNASQQALHLLSVMAIFAVEADAITLIATMSACE
jgi:hypothetical protein